MKHLYSLLFALTACSGAVSSSAPSPAPIDASPDDDASEADAEVCAGHIIPVPAGGCEAIKAAVCPLTPQGCCCP